MNLKDFKKRTMERRTNDSILVRYFKKNLLQQLISNYDQ